MPKTSNAPYGHSGAFLSLPAENLTDQHTPMMTTKHNATDADPTATASDPLEQIGDPILTQLKTCMTKVTEGRLLSPAEMVFVERYTSKGQRRGAWITTQVGISRHLQIEPNTVLAWIKKGILPRKSPDASGARGWWASELQKAYDKHKGIDQPKRRAVAGDSSEIQQGAEFALKRLDEDEAKCFADYQAAKETGDPEKIKDYRDIWRAALDDQRRHEKAVEKDRRELGELMSQATAAQIFSAMGTAMLHACDTAIKRAAQKAAGMKDPRAVAQTIRQSVYDCSLASMDLAVRAGRLPAWAPTATRAGARQSES